MIKSTINQVIALLLISVFFISMFVVATGASGQNQTKQVFKVNLVIATISSENQSVGNQYMFLLSENGSLTSSAVITVPAATEIEIIITNYDSNTDAPMVQTAMNVTGVVGNNIQVFNSVSVSQKSMSTGTGSVKYSSVVASKLSHTFSTNTGINIPILPHSTEIAYTYFQNTGTYNWGCLCQCGQFSMNTPGWMTGQINVVVP